MLIEGDGLVLIAHIDFEFARRTAAFPAETARRAGWAHVPLLCVQEIAVPGGMPRCLRVLVHVERDWDGVLPRHVYLRDAAMLRPDLATA